MPASHITLDSLPQASSSQIISAPSLRLDLLQPPKRFFRHGWQSWALTTWLDPGEPPIPIRATDFRIKDEDPAYAVHKDHISAWVGAVELGEDDILLLGALDLGGRIELASGILKGFYEVGHIDNNDWLMLYRKMKFSQNMLDYSKEIRQRQFRNSTASGAPGTAFTDGSMNALF
jgi:hypothetical protein